MPFDPKQEVVDPFEQAFAEVTDGMEGKDEKSAPVPAEVTQKLDTIQQGMNAQTVLGQLLADPAIQDILRAKQNGHQVSVVPTEQLNKPKDEAPETAPNWDELKENPQQFAEFLISRIGKDVNKSISTIVGQHVKPLSDELSNVKAGLGQQQATEASRMIESAKAKYSDFDQMKAQMAQINQATPGLSIDDLYALAKVRSGQPLVAPTAMETERPTDNVTRKPINKPSKPHPVGRRGWDQALSDALASFDVEAHLQ